MKLKALLLWTLFWVISLTISAQTKVTGTVISLEDNEPVIGATIQVVGTKTATVTDFDGKFTITVPAGKKIKVSYVGCKEQVLKPSSSMKISLESDAHQVDEVVVTGIQKTDKRLFTGATAKIDADKAKLDGVSDVSRALEGRVAGVSLQNVSGTFGTAPKISVRGATSIYGNSTPLWVVDGVILENTVDVSAEELSSGDAQTVIANAIAGLNPDDIESFQVLKDGSATSIYGARAMAGVIVVTTKKGRAGTSSINYTGEFTYRLKPSYSDYNVCNSQEQMGIYKEMAAKGWLELSSLANSSSSGIYGKMYSLIDQYNTTNGQFGLPYTQAAMNSYLQAGEFRNTDWFDLLYKDNVKQSHSVSYSTGTDRANIYASLSALLDPGWSIGTKADRYTANVNATYNLFKNFSLTARTNTSYIDQRLPGTMSQSTDVVSGTVEREFDSNVFSYALNTSRCLDPDATYTRNYASYRIFDELERNYNQRKSLDTKFQLELTYKPIQGLELNALGSYRVNNTTQEHNVLNNSNQAEVYRAGVDNPNIMYSNTYLYTDPDEPNSLPISVMPTGGIYMLQKNSVLQMDFRASARYNKVWNDTHIFNAFVGMEANKLDRDQTTLSAYGVYYDNCRLQTITPEFYKQAKEEGTTLNSFSKSWTRRMAYFANVVYSYKNRYTLNLTGRYDGSNMLGLSTQSRWLPTWNVSGSWNADEEEWFKNWSNDHNGWFSHATLRSSYSLNGNFPGDLSSSASALAVFYAAQAWRPQGSQQQTEVYLAMLANSELTYEKKREFNVGVDLGFLRNRINFVGDFYVRKCFDLMGNTYTQGAGGDITKFANVADMKSHGFEATLSTTNVKVKDFDWTTDFTFSYCKTEITSLLSQSTMLTLCRQTGAPREGYDHRALFSIPFVGLNDEGIPQVINEKGEVTTSDINFQEYSNLDNLKYEGSAEPKYTGGLNNQIHWKNLRLNVFFTYSFGNKLRLDPIFSSSYSDMSAMSKEFLNRWVMPGDENKTDIPAIASVRQLKNDPYLSYAYNAYNYSTARVADGGFIRLKDISLTYDLPSSWLRAMKVKKIALKLDVTNLCLIYSDKKLNGMDPEYVNSGGVSEPLSKQVTFTLRLGL